MLYHRINFAFNLEIAKTSLDKKALSYYIIYNKETKGSDKEEYMTTAARESAAS